MFNTLIKEIAIGLTILIPSIFMVMVIILSLDIKDSKKRKICLILEFFIILLALYGLNLI